MNHLAAPAGTTEAHDIAYAGGRRRTLDVYAPRPSAQPAPVVVFFYGGSWITGSKNWYRFVGAGLVASGALVVIPDYRLFPQVQFPAFLEDAAQAVAWARANAARFGGDPHRIFLMGHSARAHIVTLLALDPRYLRAVGATPKDVCGVVGLAGLYDFPPLATAGMKAIFGEVPDLSLTQPIAFVNRDAPPMLLTTGLWDNAIDPANTPRMAAGLRSAGRFVTVGLYPSLTHTALIESVSTQLSFISPARDDILQFIAARRACGDGSLVAASAIGR